MSTLPQGALVITGVDTFDESGRLIFFNEFAVFIRGAGKYVFVVTRQGDPSLTKRPVAMLALP